MRSWRTVLVVALTAVLLWWFARSLNFAEVGRAIARARPEFLALSVAATLVVYVLRAWRWQCLLAPIGRARFGRAFRFTVIGFAATFMLPGRIGEVLRPYLLARSEGFDVTPTLATVVIERVFDLAVVLLLFAGFVLTSGVDGQASPELWAGLRWWGSLVGAAAAAAFAVLVAAARIPAVLTVPVGWLVRRLPARIGTRVGALAATFAAGLAALRQVRIVLAVAGLSVLLWLTIAASIWFASLALNLTFSFASTFLVMMFLVVGVAVPTPAGAGSFHWMYRLAVTSFFAAPPDLAAAAAIVVHALFVVPISLLGLLFMAQEGLSLGRLRQLPVVQASRAEEGPGH